MKTIVIAIIFALFLIFCSCQNSNQCLILGQQELDNSNYLKAKNYLDQAIKKDPLNFEAYYSRAITLYSIDSVRLALNDLERATNILPDFLLAIISKVQIKFNSKDYIGAILTSREILSLDPRNTFAYNMIGFSKLELSEYEECIKVYDKSLEIEPNNYLGYLNRGQAYAHLNDYLNSKTDFSNAINHISESDVKLRKDLGIAYYDRALSNYKLNLIQDAFKDLNKSSSLGCEQAIELLRTYGN